MNGKSFFNKALWMASGVLLAYAVIFAISTYVTIGPASNETGGQTISYTDLVSIMLTSVTVVLAALGFVIAILAFIGWTAIGQKVENISSAVFLESIRDGGELHRLIMSEVQKVIYQGVAPVVSSPEENGGGEEDDAL